MDLERQLRAALVPCRPGPELRAAVMARVSAAGGARRGSGRRIVFGTILVIAAAAAMLAAYRHGLRQETAITAAAPQGSPAAAPSVETAMQAAGKPVAADESPARAAGDTPVAPPSRTVLLRPLQMESENPEVQAALRESYATIVDGLRAAPGLVLLQTDQPGTSPEPRADVRLTFIGSGDDGSAQIGSALGKNGELTSQVRRRPASRPPRNWEMVIQLERLRGQGARERTGATIDGVDRKSEYTTTGISVGGGRLASSCLDASARRSTMCRSAADLAGLRLDYLRMAIFPEDPQLRRSLRARVLDTAQSYETRFNALELLARKAGDTDLTPEVVRAALDIVAISPNPYARSRVLDMLRGHGQPTLVRALIDMSSRNSDTSLRLQALSLLIADYKDDPAARAILESLAANDPLPLMRQVAGRALASDAAWNEYVVATVKDASLPPAERFAPLAYLVQTDQKQDARKLLDDGVIAALVDVLPALVDEPSSAGLSSAVVLLPLLPDANSPAVIDLVLACLDGARTTASRAIIIDGLYKRRDDPRVRSKLEKIAADDSDLQLRQRAAAALQSAPAPRVPIP